MGKKAKKKSAKQKLQQKTIPAAVQKTIPAVIPLSYLSGFFAYAIIAGSILAAWISLEFNQNFYYLVIQEDQIIEWLTFWAFLISGISYAQAAYRQHIGESRIPWFLLCVVIFCFFVALEEISWGQRLFGYRPSAYFLEHNFQQELNFHNLIEKSLRVLGLKIVILGFGIVLPAVWMIPSIRRACWKMSIVPAPIFFAPAFLAAYYLYVVYPWKFTGELVELILGFAFLCSASAVTCFFRKPGTDRPYSFLYPVALVGIVILASVMMTFISNAGLRNQPELVKVAEKELSALTKDYREAILTAKEKTTACNLHTRFFTHVEKHKIKKAYTGHFRDLTKYGLPDERAEFFIDPWNTAYWIRHACAPETQQQQVIIYSFGPNRRRDSIAFQIRGDDIGVAVYESGLKKK